MVRAQGQRALRVLAGGDPFLGRLDAVVDRVAHEVGERVLDRLQERAVQLGLLALHRQLDLLVEHLAEVADHPGQLRPELVDRLHPGLHDPFLQLARDEIEPLGGAGQRGVVRLRGAAHQLVAHQDQLADQVHQRVEPVEVHPDARGGSTHRRRRRSRLGLVLIDGRRFWDYLSEGAATVLEREPLQKLASVGELVAYPHHGFWQPMDTLREYTLLNELWESGQAPWKVW